MYLKNLQLVGFKSFADKTNIEFLRGVTAIVGPNGCGKSNVLDAVRWVLGEQSAKALRGGEMADIIFGGTESRKAFGMAEVSLTFTECKDVLKTGQLAGMETNFDEVTVTRRIFRDGNSEYLINRTPCRLKDVQNLFMDTGIGRSSYSIMEQGKIDKILSSHPEDRRTIFEEAAGITKYKSQKKEALRKLEYTEANLLRVADIIREVKRQIGSLQRQVGKARRYQAYIAEIKHLDTQLCRYEYDQIQKQMDVLGEEASRLKSQLEDVRLEIESGEGHVSNLRDQAARAENQRQETLHRQREIQSEIERQQTLIQTNHDRSSETQSSIQTAEQEATEARTRQVELQKTLVNNREELQAAQLKIQEQLQNQEAAHAAVRESENQVKEHQGVIQQLQSSLLNAEGSLANLRNQVGSLEKQLQELGLRQEKFLGQKSLATGERQKISQRQESMHTELHAYKHTFEASRHAVMGGEDAVREAESQCQVLAAKIAEEQRLLSERSSRREVLCQLQESYEGYSEGAQAILKEFHTQSQSSGENQSALSQEILGTLANLIEVDFKYHAAIEAALGQRLQAIVVSEIQTGFKLVEQLRNRNQGRAIFAIRGLNDASNSNFTPTSESPQNSLGWASTLVRAQDTVRHLIHQLLADMVVVQNLHIALELHRANPGLSFVTLEGDILDHRGILAGGARNSSPVELLGRKNEINLLNEEINHLEARLRELSTSKGEWEGRRALARQALGDRQSELRFQENDLTKKEAFLGALQTELRELENREGSIQLEIQEVERQQKDSQENLERTRNELQQAENQQVDIKAQWAAAQQKSDELSAAHHRNSAHANEIKILCATTQQQIQTLESQVKPLETQLAETQQALTARENTIRTGRQKIVQWEGEIAQATQQIAVLQDSAKTIEVQIVTIEGSKAELEREIQKVAESLREFRQKIDDIQKQETQIEIQVTQKRSDLNHLGDRLQREYQVDLSTITLLPFEPGKKPKKVEKPQEANAEGAAEGVEEPAPTVEIQYTALYFENWDEVGVRIAELRAKLQSMGPVNLEAVQEFEELEQRYSFLTREHDDLTLSKEQLMDIIKKINVTTRQLFAETFEKIRTNFQSVFTELFGGGKADLILMDEGDPLECGIEIVAKPPGKQLQSISLLSGGERTMTAVSLLFAIYMVKPSPFCVLDEMDAPLDESNINRFIKMLERFLVHSQFVVITHNKRTIGMADALYGVTMEERGVSKVVSVRFHKSNEAKPAAKSDKKEEHAPHLLVEVPPLETSPAAETPKA